MTAVSSTVDTGRDALVARYRRIRARTRAIFDLLREEAYYARPIALRNPVVFYDGHLPGFAVNTLLKKGLGEPGIDTHLETIFARGIDPETEASAQARGNPAWPPRDEVRAFADEAERRIIAALATAEIVRDGHPLLQRGQAAWAILEHEEMHQETLLYMWHQLPYALKRMPEGYVTAADAPSPRPERVPIQAGTVTRGTPPDEPFAWDNERPSQVVEVEAFDIDAHNVTNAQYLAYMRATGAAGPPFWERDGDRWFWRGMFERVPLPDAWPVYVTWDEAHAYARWAGGRLPTEAEFHRAAFGTPTGLERRHPWGNDAPTPAHGNFDFERFDPVPAGSRPAGASAWGVHDLVGNGWEWTSTVFSGFDGFEPLPSYPEYSAEFFDGEHYVIKGASPVTARELLRPGFRNWFRPRYPYVYAAFRCVR